MINNPHSYYSLHKPLLPACQLPDLGTDRQLYSPDTTPGHIPGIPRGRVGAKSTRQSTSCSSAIPTPFSLINHYSLTAAEMLPDAEYLDCV